MYQQFNQHIIISTYHDTDGPLYKDTKGRRFSWPTCPSGKDFSDPRISPHLMVTLPTEHRRVGCPWARNLPKEDLRKRPLFGGLLAMALTLAGQKGPFSLEKKEQAEVGQSLTCLPLRHRKGRLGNPPGVPRAAGSGKIKEKRTLQRVRYIQ